MRVRSPLMCSGAAVSTRSTVAPAPPGVALLAVAADAVGGVVQGQADKVIVAG